MIKIFVVGMAIAAIMGCEEKESVSARGKASVSPAAPSPVTQAPGALKTSLSEIDSVNTVNLDTGALKMPVSGAVTSSSDSVGALAVNFGLVGSTSLTSFFSLSGGSGCSSGTYTAKKIGGGGSAVIENQAFSGNYFTIPSLSVSDELAVEFTCADASSLRCLAKPGDKGILCNKIADTVLTVFEHVIGKTIYDSSFSGKPVAKLAASIVEQAKMSGDETDAFKDEIAACSGQSGDALKTCLKDAIYGSPFSGAFRIMKQIASGWDAEGLLTFVTDVLGLEASIDSSLYMTVVEALDEGLGNTFIADLQAHLITVINAQTAQSSSYPYTVSCFVDINETMKSYAPTVTNGKVTCDQTQANEIMTRAGIGAGDRTQIINDGYSDGSVSCTVPGAPGGMCWVEISVLVKGKNVEPNRNDMAGIKRQPPKRRISLIDVMPQVMTILVDYGFTGDPPAYDPTDPAQKAKMDQAMPQMKNYFLGLVGIYRFLNDPVLSKFKLSLNDLHDIFVGDNFMRTRLSTYGPGMRSGTISDAHISPILDYDATTDKFSINPIFKDSGSGITINQSQLDAAMASSVLPKSHTFSLFESIPNSTAIGNYVFNSSHHEEWNPMGQKYLFVAEFQTSGKPIACKLTNPGIGFRLKANTTLTCDTSYTGVSCDTDGVCTFPNSYEYPFILFERGWYGDNIGRMFALGSRKTGIEVGMGGGDRGVMIKEYKAGNPAGQCDISQVGTVIDYIEEFWCGHNSKCEERVRAYCMDFSSLAAAARKRFYPGGFHEVSGVHESTGERWSWQVPMIGVYDGSNHDNDYAGCLHVPDGTFVAAGSSGDNLATLNLNTSTGVVDTGISGASIKNCSEAASAGQSKYRLFQWKDFASGDEPYAFLLNGADDSELTFKRPVAGENWNQSLARITKSNIEAIAGGGKTVSGGATTQINGMKYKNPRHNPRFDPYCDDINGNGFCDCYPVSTISDDRKTITYSSTVRTDPSECGLMDKAAEPTVSELPYCPSCGTESQKAEAMFDTYGGKSGSELATLDSYITTNGVMIDFQRVFVCKFKFSGDSKPRQPRWLDWGNWDGSHEGCPAAEGDAYASNATGPVRLMSLKPMNNAFDIERPKGMIKLINYATKTVGQGATIDPTKKLFSLDEAIALIMVRQLMPPEATVLDENGDEARQFMAGFESIEKPGSYESPFSMMLKGFMYKAGMFSLEDTQATRE